MKVILKLLFILYLFLISSALGHKVNIWAHREKEQIAGESYFADGSPCRGCKIEIYNHKGIKIAETQTNEFGKFILGIKETGELKVIVEAGEGHKAEYKLEALSTEKISEKKTEKFNKVSIGEEKKVNSENIQLLKKTLEETIDDKLQNFKTEILLEVKKEMHKTYLRDVIGGIGYILGVWGLIALLRSRKKTIT